MISFNGKLIKRTFCFGLLVPLLSACAPVAKPDRTESAEPVTSSQRTGAEIFASCQICHSTKELQRGPIIDGLPAWYVTLQLEKFHDGIRGANEENRSAFLMGSTKDTIQPEEFARVAEYIAGLPPQEHLKVIRGDTERGKIVYQTCVVCHGERGEGNAELKAPPLNILEDWYLLDQLRKFKNGQRGSDPGDTEGILMQQAMAAIDENDFRDLVHYIATDLAESRASSNTGGSTQ